MKDGKTVIIEVIEHRKKNANNTGIMDPKSKLKDTVDNKNAIIEINYGRNEKPDVASESSNHN